MNKKKGKGLDDPLAITKVTWNKAVGLEVEKHLGNKSLRDTIPMDKTEMGDIKDACIDYLKDFLRRKLNPHWDGHSSTSDLSRNSYDVAIDAVNWDELVDRLLSLDILYSFTATYVDCSRELWGYQGNIFFVINETMTCDPSCRVGNSVVMSSDYRIGYIDTYFQVLGFQAKTTNPIALIQFLESNYQDWEPRDPLSLSNLILRVRQKLSRKEADSMYIPPYPIGVIQEIDL